MRLAVIGTSGSGKSTLAKEVAERLGIKYIEQDEIFWKPNWQITPKDEFHKKMSKEIAGDQWTVCGNHSFFQENIWKRSTHIIWLNYSLRICLWRGFKRTWRRVFYKQKCCNGNTESFKHAFLSTDSILWWILKTYRKRILQYRTAEHEGKFDEVVFLEFKDPNMAKDWLSSL